MARYVFRMPDVGEGVTEAEVVEWQVTVGNVVREDEVLCSVMTDKAAVELPSPVTGTVTALGAGVGDMVAVGGELVVLEVSEHAAATPTPMSDDPVGDTSSIDTAQTAATVRAPAPRPATVRPLEDASEQHAAPATRPLASPAVRRRARELDIDLRQVTGSGPSGRIVHADLENHARPADEPQHVAAARDATPEIETVKVIGLRRRIAERMQVAKREIPHITYVEEIDVSELERLRQHLNERRAGERTRLTVLPFVMAAMVRAIVDFPRMNAHFDGSEQTIAVHQRVHLGVATQTPAGLVVPVVRDAHTRDVWQIASEVARLASAARDSTATREELTGSTITVSSLGPLGGLMSTPVINYPEVAIIGVNKVRTIPVFVDATVVPRQMMNLSSSFDHRVVDGWDAASFVQRIRELLEHPATLFMAK